MITILEGTDGVGKSSAAFWMAEQTGQQIIHFGRPVAHGDPLEMYIGTLARHLMDGESVILDRSHFGSMVWSRMGFHEPTMTPAIFRAVCRWHASQNAQASILVRPEDELVATLEARGDSGIAASVQAQALYFRMVADREILYHPVTIVASSVFHYNMTNDEGE